MPLPWRVFLGLDSILSMVDFGFAMVKKQRGQCTDKTRRVKQLDLL
jgi:hypothetical protein